MAAIVRGAKLEGTTTYIGQTRRDLPTLLRERIGAGHASWTVFLQAIRDIDIDHICDGVDIWKKEQNEQEAIKRRIQQLEKLTASPTAPLHQQLTAFNLRNRPPSPSPAPRQAAPRSINPFANNSGRRNLPPFTQNQTTTQNYAPRPPPSQADRASLIAQLSKYPQHPDTEAGRQAHQAQQADWVKTYGLGTRVTESTPYPLRPGTAPVNSGECFT